MTRGTTLFRSTYHTAIIHPQSLVTCSTNTITSLKEQVEPHSCVNGHPREDAV